MDALKLIFASLSIALLSGCQIGYYLSSAYNQASLLNQRVPIEKALKDPKLTDDEKKKLELAQAAREFAESTLKLKHSKSYTTYVKLDRPYVTYVVSAAPKWKLEHHLWSFPFVGKMPYKGFFNESAAKEEQEELKKEDFDTYMRGVSAYSTLGYFNDPLLSSMLRYSDYNLVNTIIHETVHATIYIKNSADFNERLAVFLGNKGAEMFYRAQEGTSAPTLKAVQNDNIDEKVFSEFISQEIKDLTEWYQTQTGKTEQERIARIKLIQEHFEKNVKSKLRSDSYKRFAEIELNNARLLVYKTYVQDLSDFEKLYEQSGNDITVFLDKCRSLEKHKNPEQGLKELIAPQ